MNAKAVAMVLALLSGDAQAQGFGGLGTDAPGFAAPKPGTALVFPKDHGAHPNFRTEWWYLTANLKGADGVSYGVQWTLFRHALEPKASRDGWDDRNIWMAHAAATSATAHVFAQKLARGGIKQAGVEAAPFHAFIDDWTFESRDAAPDAEIKRLRVHARDKNFSFTLDLAADAPSRAARRGRLQPQIRRGTGVALLQPAFLQGRRSPVAQRPRNESRGPRLDGPRMVEPAARAGPEGVGLVLASSCRRREANAVSPAQRNVGAIFSPAIGSRLTAPSRYCRARIFCWSP